MAYHIHWCQKWILSQSTAFKAVCLPVGFEEGEVEVLLSVVGFLRNLVKHECFATWSVLFPFTSQINWMTNITFSFSLTSKENQAVNVLVLCQSSAINRALRMCGDSVQGMETIQQKWTTPLKIRVAFLQMLKAHHYFYRPPGDTSSQWDLIDDYLEVIRSWGLLQKQA